MNQRKSIWGTLTLIVSLALAALATPATAASLVPGAGLCLAQTGIDRDGTLDSDEIAQLARSVVLIGVVQGGYIYLVGSGTIFSPERLILTNAHVVEGAKRVYVGVLDDINDPPQWRYQGNVVRMDTRVDVAVIALHSDVNGRSLRGPPDLPYLTMVADEVYRGDDVYIFGYPITGDDYLVMTRGTIVSVENGYFDEQRMPVWYRTDAEIAPGNSGGLAVNGNGEFVGIPTFVAHEYETGGRLGGILPAQVALLAAQAGQAPPQGAPGGKSPPCVGAPPPRMIVNHFGRVTFTTGESVRVRTGPGTGYRVLAHLPEGTIFYVTGGPVCAGSYWWWSVQTRRGTRGWMAEGVVGNYFIEPFSP